MTKVFNIFGDIVDTDNQKFNQEDTCPNDFKQFIETVEDGDDVEIHLNSCGGSVTGGISIANMVSQLSKSNKTIAKVDGIAASIASVIACACDELHMGKSSFLMIHQVWGNVSGNCDELRKEADVMEMMTKSLLSFYHRKFNLSDEELLQYLKNESWISGQDAVNFNLNVIIDDDIQEIKYAAKLIDKISKKFNNQTIIESLKNMEETEIKEVENVELSAVSTEEVKEEVIEEVKDNPDMTKEEIVEEVKEEVVEEKKEEDKPSYEVLEKMVEELTNKLAECEKKLAECTDEDVEKRVAKCQSTFQNKINNFKNELKVKDEELQKFKDSVSSLQSELEESKKELHDMSAAFEEKNNALAKLNAGVLSIPIENKTDWRNLKGKDFINWVESHKDEIKNNKIN